MTTTIQVDDETADELHERKQRGDTYDDVVRRLLEETGDDPDGGLEDDDGDVDDEPRGFDAPEPPEGQGTLEDVTRPVDGLEFLSGEIDGLRDDLSEDEFDAVADLLESSTEDVDGSIRFRDQVGNLTGDLEDDDVSIEASRFEDEIVVDATVGATVHALGNVEALEDAVVDVGEIIGGLDLPGSGATLEARRDAVRACYDCLRDEGEAAKSDFVDDVYPDHSARYGSSGGWWNAIGKQGLRAVADEHPTIDAPAEGEHLWEWTG